MIIPVFYFVTDFFILIFAKNTVALRRDYRYAATNIAMSKKESKSQRTIPGERIGKSCYKYRNVKERKQITTYGTL